MLYLIRFAVAQRHLKQPMFSSADGSVLTLLSTIKRVAAIRLRDKLGLVEGTDYQIEGIPRNLEGCKDLWTRDKYHFQKWAIEQIDGFATTKRTSDGGIDGRLYFKQTDDAPYESMAIEVKGGQNVNISDLRALHGVVENDQALLGGLIIMEPLGTIKDRNFRRFMAKTGDVQIGKSVYPRLQMLSVPEILEGKHFDTPRGVG